MGFFFFWLLVCCFRDTFSILELKKRPTGVSAPFLNTQPPHLLATPLSPASRFLSPHALPLRGPTFPQVLLSVDGASVPRGGLGQSCGAAAQVTVGEEEDEEDFFSDESLLNRKPSPTRGKGHRPRTRRALCRRG